MALTRPQGDWTARHTQQSEPPTRILTTHLVLGGAQNAAKKCPRLILLYLFYRSALSLSPSFAGARLLCCDLMGPSEDGSPLATYPSGGKNTNTHRQCSGPSIRPRLSCVALFFLSCLATLIWANRRGSGWVGRLVAPHLRVVEDIGYDGPASRVSV